jgi:hypothetical protein
LIISSLILAENDLRNDTVTEHDKDERAHEFGEGLPRVVSDPRPHQSAIQSLSAIEFCRLAAVDERSVFGIWR